MELLRVRKANQEKINAAILEMQEQELLFHNCMAKSNSSGNYFKNLINNSKAQTRIIENLINAIPGANEDMQIISLLGIIKKADREIEWLLKN